MIYKLIFFKVNYIYKKEISLNFGKKTLNKKLNLKIEKHHLLNIT